jgi:hypothetical protein
LELTRDEWILRYRRASGERRAALVYSLFGGVVTVELEEGSYQVLLLNPATGKRTRRPPVAGGSREIALAGGEQVLLLRRRGVV